MGLTLTLTLTPNPNPNPKARSHRNRLTQCAPDGHRQPRHALRSAAVRLWLLADFVRKLRTLRALPMPSSVAIR